MSRQNPEEDEPGTIYYDRQERGVRGIVMRGPFSLTAYLGVPADHPLTAVGDYDDLPLNVHGGLTYSGCGKEWPQGWYWWGWDYAHAGDLSYESTASTGDREHNFDDVLGELNEAWHQFEKLARLAERVAAWTTKKAGA